MCHVTNIRKIYRSEIRTHHTAETLLKLRNSTPYDQRTALVRRMHRTTHDVTKYK